MSDYNNNGAIPPLLPGDATVSNGIFTKTVHMYESLLIDGSVTVDGTVTAGSLIITSTNPGGLTVDQIACDTLTASVGITSAGYLTVLGNVSLGTSNTSSVLLNCTKLGFFGVSAVNKQTATQPTATYFAGTAAGVLIDTTYNGYTVSDVVTALQAYGLLE